MTPAETVQEAIRQLVRARGPQKTICPSEAARALAARHGDADNWRPFMEPVRAAAFQLARAGEIEVLQRGAPCDLNAPPRGPIRLRIAVV